MAEGQNQNDAKNANGSSTKETFCVAQNSFGQPVKLFSENLKDFPPIINDANIAWVNCTVEDMEKDGQEVAKALGFSPVLVQSLLSDSDSAYEDEDLELGMKLPVLRVSELNVSVYPLLILAKRGLVLTMHTKEVTRLKKFARYAETFMRKIPTDAKWNDKITMIIFRLLAENNERNFDGLREIEEEADTISHDLMDPKTPREKLGVEIYRMKHALIVYLNGLWNILDVLHSLRYGDAEIITDDPALLVRLESLVTDVTGQISLSEHMSEVLASGLEVLQSIYNNQLQILNNKMAMVVAWLTILGTAVLVPNTLATIMGSSAFALTPEDKTWYIALMAGSTAVATIVSYLFVKRWLPRKTE